MRERDLGNRGDRTVGADQQARAALGKAPHGRLRQAIAVAHAVGQVVVDVGAEPAQRSDENRRRADPIDVVVAVDRDPPARSHVTEDRRDRALDPGERARRVLLVGLEDRAGAHRIAQPAPDEHLGERPADPQLAPKARDVGARALGDLKAWRLHDPPTYGQAETEPRGGLWVGRALRLVTGWGALRLSHAARAFPTHALEIHD